MRALNIERLPWMADWPFSFIKYDEKYFVPILNYMQTHPAVVEDACNELAAIYKHTQKFYDKKKFIKLGRGYRGSDKTFTEEGDYAKEIYRHAVAARMLDIPEIEVPQDVITSWGHTSQYSNYIVGIDMDIPVKDILLSSDVIAPRKNEIQRAAIEPGEFLILNRNWQGLFKVNADSVKTLSGFNVKEPENKDEAKRILSRPLPAYRPMSNYTMRTLPPSKAPQTFKSRLTRSWKILTTKNQ